MSDESESERIIKINEVKDGNFIKKLGDDKMFRFECENKDEKLRIGLKEINAYSPYYYEAFYSKGDLDEMNDVFKSLSSIDVVIKQLSKLIGSKGELKTEKDDNKCEKIDILFEIPSFAEKEIIKFELERKTIEDKDKGLMFLFDIQKKNIDIINQIKKLYSKYKNEQVSRRIMEILSK